MRQIIQSTPSHPIPLRSILILSSILQSAWRKVEEKGSLETLVHSYKTIRRHIPDTSSQIFFNNPRWRKQQQGGGWRGFMGVRRPERAVHSPPPSAEVKIRYTFTCSKCLHSAVLMQAHGQPPQFPQAVYIQVYVAKIPGTSWPEAAVTWQLFTVQTRKLM